MPFCDEHEPLLIDSSCSLLYRHTFTYRVRGLITEGKTKSIRFREELGLKMFLSEVLNLLERHRLYNC
jgi:hypothetical protein